MSTRDMALAKRCFDVLNPMGVLRKLAKQGTDSEALLWFMKFTKTKPDERVWQAAAASNRLALAKGMLFLGARAEGIYHAANLLNGCDLEELEASAASDPKDSGVSSALAFRLLFSCDSKRYPLEQRGVQLLFEECPGVLDLAALRVLATQLSRPLSRDTLVRARAWNLPCAERGAYVRLLLDLKAELYFAADSSGQARPAVLFHCAPTVYTQSRETARCVELAGHLIQTGINVNDLPIVWSAVFDHPFLVDLHADLAPAVIEYLGPIDAELSCACREALLAYAENRPRRTIATVRSLSKRASCHHTRPRLVSSRNQS